MGLLSDAIIQRLGPREKAYWTRDGRGLSIVVFPNGQKYWRVSYCINGKYKYISIGRYPDVSLEDARKKRDEIRLQVLEGYDPSALRKQRKLQNNLTFEKVFWEWFEHGRERWSKEHAEVQKILSGLPVWFSDALCRLATGGGLGVRTLYSDRNETLFYETRPIILNGIGAIATRPDLLERTIILYLPPILDEERKVEMDFWNEFEKDAPYILGALFDIVSTGLKNLDGVNLKSSPRMSSFVKWCTACQPSLPGDFVTAYIKNAGETFASTLEAEPVAFAVMKLLENCQEWKGTAGELLAELLKYTTEQEQNSRAWPKTPQTLSNRLERIAPVLRKNNVEIEKYREPGTGRRVIGLRLCAASEEQPLTPKNNDNRKNDSTKEKPSSDKNCWLCKYLGGVRSGRPPSCMKDKSNPVLIENPSEHICESFEDWGGGKAPVYCVDCAFRIDCPLEVKKPTRRKRFKRKEEEK